MSPLGIVHHAVKVTILILIDGFLQFIIEESREKRNIVTILILIDGFLQYNIDGFFELLTVWSQSLF